MRTAFFLTAVVAAGALLFCSCGGTEFDESTGTEVYASVIYTPGDNWVAPSKKPPPAPCITCPPLSILPDVRIAEYGRIPDKVAPPVISTPVTMQYAVGGDMKIPPRDSPFQLSAPYHESALDLRTEPPPRLWRK